MTTFAPVSLDDKWQQNHGQVYLTGSQALARLPMLQAIQDQQAGYNTAGFISGYRGSPLGHFDKTLWQIKDRLTAHNITFQPGVNEDLGATAVWGSQQANVFPGAKYDGVFGLWYGKGPGVDRSGDVFKHANAFGTTPLGGVLAVAGDDHACKSSTLPHQSDYAFMDALMPYLYPGNIQELIEYGLYGWAMSRYSGCWVGLKALAEVMDSGSRVDLNQTRVTIGYPVSEGKPSDGLNARWPDKPLQQEVRLHEHKLEAARAFCRANKLDKTIINPLKPRLGIISAGKSYLDVLQALEDLGISHELAEDLGIRLYKVAMPWPLEPQGIEAFSQGLDEILVIEEKRGVIEEQLRQQLYQRFNTQGHTPPRITGKLDNLGQELLTTLGELTPAMIARAIARRTEAFYSSPETQQRLDFLTAKEAELARPRALIERTPHFCSGCPHNTSTTLPDGSRALGGIGCHYMATWMNRGTETFTQMGGEGATWIGQAPFTETNHVFQNLGDGTYFHSGLLAIRAAVASGVNITYKILYNDAVAMTGGQPVDGSLSVQQISHQVYGEGIRRIAIVSDDPGKYRNYSEFASGVTFHHRDELQAVQLELRDIEGCSVMIYDQTCAAEKRRRRHRGQMHNPAQRVVINSEICEGCGDCGVQSNCLSVEPLETERGRKRNINQSSCNKDFSCVRGFCPSFVTVKGGELRKPDMDFSQISFPALPEPQLPACNTPYNIMLTGVGGTGVVTVSALLGMAAHIENKGIGVLDQIGLAQKFGAVMSHIRIADSQERIHTVRIPAGETDLMVSFDLMVGASEEALGKLESSRSHVVINNHKSMPAAFTREPDLEVPNDAMEAVIQNTAVQSYALDATELATHLLGDGMAVNLFCIGYAWQQGLIPLERASIEQAIKLNGVAVQANIDAFLWGRRAAVDLAAVRDIAFGKAAPAADAVQLMPSLDTIIQREKQHLTGYQNRALAKRYEKLVQRVQLHTKDMRLGQRLAIAVATQYSKLLAYKDEYEVARQLTSDTFRHQLKQQFTGEIELEFNLAPPLLAKTDPATGRPRKRKFSQKYLPVLKLLAKLKPLRGTALDIFAYSHDRQLERQLIQQYEQDIRLILSNLSADNYAAACALAELPGQIRGYGPVKDAAWLKVQPERLQLLSHFSSDNNPAAKMTAT
ncbi:indolepyruvate ferredoxin oxidoreductase family protein [Aliamphritea hakodatensis]|uniref:indolepyruvate ferredoxin oxidoreductase family protein n=1 Tax=Aliamphritea hakodatensis TaxID=2895352 RepID=UPI0022FD9B4F|nr:indolepyruvate ferredoxin oxidoreductase family protein [Aliamphritea hakodatensis]